ncbi:MAG: hypothetical protein LH477_18450 [Nocardioides sp.]|nr:hypothetical protein [Nocardioides sp.]
MSTTTRTPITTSRSVRRAGVWCLGAGLVGAAQALILLAWVPQVSDNRYSYPFTGFGFVVAQTSFFLQHLPLIVGVAALLWLPAARTSWTARIATGAAAVGLMLLTAMELITIVAYDAATDSSLATLVNNLYGPPVILIGAGLIVAGIALLRQGTSGWVGARWVPALVLLMGVYVFVPLTPAIMGTFTAGRLGIGGWMLLFAVLGYGLTRLRDEQQR